MGHVKAVLFCFPDRRRSVYRVAARSVVTAPGIGFRSVTATVTTARTAETRVELRPGVATGRSHLGLRSQATAQHGYDARGSAREEVSLAWSPRCWGTFHWIAVNRPGGPSGRAIPLSLEKPAHDPRSLLSRRVGADAPGLVPP